MGSEEGLQAFPQGVRVVEFGIYLWMQSPIVKVLYYTLDLGCQQLLEPSSSE